MITAYTSYFIFKGFLIFFPCITLYVHLLIINIEDDQRHHTLKRNPCIVEGKSLRIYLVLQILSLPGLQFMSGVLVPYMSRFRSIKKICNIKRNQYIWVSLGTKGLGFNLSLPHTSKRKWPIGHLSV